MGARLVFRECISSTYELKIITAPAQTILYKNVPQEESIAAL